MVMAIAQKVDICDCHFVAYLRACSLVFLALAEGFTMSTHRCARIGATVATVVAAVALLPLARASAQGATTPVSTGSHDGAVQRDGQRDFDFLNGTWKVHLKRLLHPLTGSTTWVEYEGTATARPLMDGRAQIDEFDAEDPKTHSHIGGMTLRLYNPESHEWSLYYVNARTGTLGLPPTVGHFTDGRGEFYDRETFEGKPIIVRYQWSDITPTSAHFEQAFSADDGKTWEVNWIYTCERVKE